MKQWHFLYLQTSAITMKLACSLLIHHSLKTLKRYISAQKGWSKCWIFFQVIMISFIYNKQNQLTLFLNNCFSWWLGDSEQTKLVFFGCIFVIFEHLVLHLVLSKAGRSVDTLAVQILLYSYFSSNWSHKNCKNVCTW